MSCCSGRRGFYGRYGTVIVSYEQMIEMGLSPEAARLAVANQQAGFERLLPTAPPVVAAPQKDNTGLILGGLAALAAIFVVTR